MRRSSCASSPSSSRPMPSLGTSSSVRLSSGRSSRGFWPSSGTGSVDKRSVTALTTIVVADDHPASSIAGWSSATTMVVRAVTLLLSTLPVPDDGQNPLELRPELSRTEELVPKLGIGRDELGDDAQDERRIVAQRAE